MQDEFKARPWLMRLARVRMADWVIAAALLMLLVWVMSPQQLPVSVYKLSLVALAAVAGYWVDRSLFPYARPDLFFELRHGTDDAPADTTFTSLAGVVSFAEQQTTINLEGAAPAELMRLAGSSMLRRAVIVSATMLAVGLGA
jgi:hypothetical protein